MVQDDAAQKWYIELDDLASPQPESEMIEVDSLDENIVVEEDGKVCISCKVFTSPGTSEVGLIILAFLFTFISI